MMPSGFRVVTKSARPSAPAANVAILKTSFIFGSCSFSVSLMPWLARVLPAQAPHTCRCQPLAKCRLRDHPNRDSPPNAVARPALIGDEIGIIAVHELVTIRRDPLRH